MVSDKKKMAGMLPDLEKNENRNENRKEK